MVEWPYLTEQNRTQHSSLENNLGVGMTGGERIHPSRQGLDHEKHTD
jgi:hypothetical protein